MQYSYSIGFNDVQSAWTASWTGHDPEHPHQMKGNLEICNSFDEGMEKVRDFATEFEPQILQQSK
jgi:hypothetical protein